jgi:hypothetical protein
MMDPARSTACLSRLQCDRWLNGELANDDELAAHCAACTRCAALLDAHRRERAELAIPLRAGRRWTWVATTAAAAAAVLVWMALPDRGGPMGSTDGEERIKGRPQIGFYVKHGDAVRRGGGGEVVFPGDALNFTASTERAGYLAILSVDGAGHLSAYYPGGSVAALLPAGSDQVLPLSVVLDDVLGTERLYGVFCDRAIAVAELVAMLARGGAFPAGCVADTLAIEKRAP